MSRENYNIAVAAMNGRPQRLVSIDRPDGVAFRDHINPDSARSRRNFIRAAAGKFDVTEEELAWLDDAIVSAADDADAQAEAEAEAVPGGDREERKSQATKLVELAGNIELFHDPDGNGFAKFPVNEHLEVAAVRNKRFRTWLARLFYLAEGKTPSLQAMQDAIGVLEGTAVFAGQTRPVHVRVAGHEDKIYVDLCNDKWQVVEVSVSGWRVLDESPVMFRRPKAMLPLPLPVKGGSVNELRRFVHMEDSDWVLFLGWLVAALRPIGPYPLLDLQGEHGSGKSTVCRMARSLVDPNTAPLRSEPREPRDLMIAANNGWVIALDNLSGIQPWQSDCLCRLSTGGGFSTRTLYSDDDETIFDATRPSVINGIEEIATRADLLDRCLLLNLPRIEQNQRRPESELWHAFEEARPRILGALLSAVAIAMRQLPSTHLAALPRMADFALWATAAEPGLGLEHGQFVAAYHANRNAGNEVALESSPVGKAVMEFVASVGQWEGTSTQLLEELERRADESTRRLKSWPSTAQVLGGAIKRLAPNLRSAGVGVESERTGRRRVIVLQCQQELSGNSSSEPSPSSSTPQIPDSSTLPGDDWCDGCDSSDGSDFESLSQEKAESFEEYHSDDGYDDCDNDFTPNSDSLSETPF